MREARRDRKAFQRSPIDAESLLDGKTERLPKHLPRHLLPKTFDRRSVDSLTAQCRNC